MEVALHGAYTATQTRYESAGEGLSYWLIFLPMFGVISPSMVLFFSAENNYLIPHYNLFHELPRAILVFVTGFSFTVAGFFFLPQPRYAISSYELGSSLFWLWCIFFTLILLLMSQGSLSGLLASAEALSSKVSGSSESQTTVYALLPVLGILSFLNTAKLMSTTNRANIAEALIPVLCTAALCFFAGSRSRAISAILAPMIFYAGRPTRKWLNLLPILLLIVAIASVGDQVRRQAQGVTEESLESPVVLFIGSFSIIDSIAVAVFSSSEAPKTLSDSVWNIVQWILPKSIVGSKDMNGAVMARYLLEGDTLGGITLSSYGEIYFYFGMLGVAVGGLMIGYLIRTYVRMTTLGGVTGLIAFYIAYNYIFVTNRNGVINDLPDFIIFNLFLLLALLMGSFRRPVGTAA